MSSCGVIFTRYFLFQFEAELLNNVSNKHVGSPCPWKRWCPVGKSLWIHLSTWPRKGRSWHLLMQVTWNLQLAISFALRQGLIARLYFPWWAAGFTLLKKSSSEIECKDDNHRMKVTTQKIDFCKIHMYHINVTETCSDEAAKNWKMCRLCWTVTISWPSHLI